ncbi:MAG: aspartate aminotransferase family protein [Methylomicrobium sp.]|nr:aspartate aminotransferase family protein [Methylomicrobium sp.]
MEGRDAETPESMNYVETEIAEGLVRGISAEALEAGICFERGEGSRLYDTNGREYLDLSAGILTNAVGHCHPYVIEALREQVGKLGNIHDFPYPERLKLMRMLKERLPIHLNRFVFLTTGAEAVEATIRIIVNHHGKKPVTIAAIREGYHGKTLGAKRLIRDAEEGDVPGRGSFQNNAKGTPAYCYRCPLEKKYPGCEIACAKETCQNLKKHNARALIFEPVMGARGVIIPPQGYWEEIGQFCKSEGITTAADEILTGGGRTGEFLASVQLGITPDIAILAKGIASGFPFAVITARDEVSRNPISEQPGEFSATFASHPFSLRAATATLEAMDADKTKANVAERAKDLKERLDKLREEFNEIGDARSIGLLGAIEFVKDRKTKEPDEVHAARVFRLAMTEGVKTLLGGCIIRLAPPLNISKGDLKEGLGLLRNVLRKAKKA